MKPELLAKLRALTALEDRAAREALRRAADAEARLAAEARELDVIRQKAVAAEGLDEARRRAGADAAWQAWLGMRRTSVLSAQARARAELNVTTEAARRVFARAEAAERLEMEAQRAALRAKAEAEARRCETLEILRRPAPGVRRPAGRFR